MPSLPPGLSGPPSGGSSSTYSPPRSGGRSSGGFLPASISGGGSGTRRVVIGGRTVDGSAASKRAASDRAMADQVAILRHLKAQTGTDNWFQRALKNNAAAGLRILTSLPSQAVLAAKIPSAGVIGAYGQLGRVVPLPASASARSWSESAARDVYDSTLGTVSDIKRRWSPVLSGDWDQVGRNLESGDALIMALEVATLGRAGGSAAGVARRGAASGARGAIARGVDTPLTRYLSTTTHFDKSPTAAIRQRGTRTYNLRDAETGDVIHSVERDLGRYSKNPVVRGGQRLRTNIANTLQEKVLDDTPLGRKQYDWRQKQNARQMGRGIQSQLAETIDKETRAADRAIRQLDKMDKLDPSLTGTRPQYEKIAAFMHAQGWLQHPDPSLTKVEIRNLIVDQFEKAIDERATIVGEKGVARSRQQLKWMREIPASMLDLNTAPSRLRNAVTEIEKMGLATSELRLAMVKDDGRRAALAQSFEDASYRGAGQLHAGVEFDPNKPTASTEVIRAERDAARSELKRLTSRSDTSAERDALTTAEATGRENLRVRREQIRNEIRIAKEKRRRARNSRNAQDIKEAERRLAALQDELKSMTGDAERTALARADIADSRELISGLRAALRERGKMDVGNDRINRLQRQIDTLYNKMDRRREKMPPQKRPTRDKAYRVMYEEWKKLRRELVREKAKVRKRGERLDARADGVPVTTASLTSAMRELDQARIALQRAKRPGQRDVARLRRAIQKARSELGKAKRTPDKGAMREADVLLRTMQSRALRAEGRNVDDPLLLRRLERALGRAQEKRVGSVFEIAAAARRLQAAQARYERAIKSKSGRGDWTVRGPAWEGQRPATYMKHVPVDPIPNPKAARVSDIQRGMMSGGGVPGTSTSVMQGLGPVATHKSHGTLLRTANLLADPRMSLLSAKEAITAAFRAKFAHEFTVRNAIVGADGKPITGEAAFRLAAQNPDSVVLVAADRLAKSLDDAVNLDEGKYLTDLQTEGMFYTKVAKDSSVIEEIRANPKGYVAVPKAFHDTAVGMMRDPRSAAEKFFDNGMNTWKSGMLVYAPRWWVNNLIGNSFMYGMLAGFDIRSIRQAVRSLRNDRLADIIPSDMKAHGLVNEVLEGRRAYDNPGDRRIRTRVGRFTERAFHWQNSLEQIWRRAAYINRVKGQARDAGVLGRKMRIKDADEALILAVDQLPDFAKADALHDALLFLGDYQNLTAFEKRFVRKAFPWYAWMRVISRLTFTLPFKHPGRMLAMAYLGQAATDIEQPLDDIRDFYNQGMISLGGDLVMRTTSSNPMQTFVEPIAKLASGDFGGAGGDLLGQINPGLQIVLAKAFGLDSFTNRGFTAPAVWNGSYDQFGMGRKRINPNTGRLEEVKPTPSTLDLIIRSTPIVNQVRPFLSDQSGYTPYGTTSTLDLIRYALGSKTPEEKARLFYPPSEEMRPATRSAWSTAAGYFGVPFFHRNEEAEVDRALKDLESRLPDAQEAARKRMEGNVKRFLEERLR